MKDKEILEGNKLIAEFMGLRKASYYTGLNEFQAEELEYATSYDWLMPVVEKIEDLNWNDGKLSEYLHINEIEFNTEGNEFLIPFRITSKSYYNNIPRIELYYEAVIDFIKWYNIKK